MTTKIYEAVQELVEALVNEMDYTFVKNDEISEMVTTDDIASIENDVNANEQDIQDLRRELDVIRNLLTETLTAQRDAIDNQITLFNWAMNQGH